MRNGIGGMKKGNDQKRDQVQRVITELAAIGEDITYEQAEAMMDSMQQLVTLVINQYFRKSLLRENTSSTNI
ncbi:hypothetical protein [Dyadobacter sp. MSC1_007]|uniref:hypothetical protein n=1 Tax=Dyadobacter sp. MSC1_007 TaxID=2909264 RepID=UPI0020301008|nr:hypothetical protein [Dyadobacter sp. MSC1_007]